MPTLHGRVVEGFMAVAILVMFAGACGSTDDSNGGALPFEFQRIELCQNLQDSLYQAESESVKFRIVKEMDSLGCPITGDPRFTPKHPPGGYHPEHRDGYCDENDFRLHCQQEHYRDFCADDDDIRFWCHEARYHSY